MRKNKKVKVESLVCKIEYVGYVSYRRFRALYTPWTWAFSYNKSRFNAQYTYVNVRILGFEFDGLIPNK
jgi:hypothetical protein